MLYWVVLLLSATLFSCSDKNTGGENIPDSGARLLLPEGSNNDAGPDAYLIDIQNEQPDASTLPSQEYQDQCWRSQYWQCPPFDQIWRVEVIFDVCDETGTPCTPEGIADPNCEWTLVSEGECLNYQECDPAHIGISYQPCQVESESGELLPGQQEVRCRKGSLERGECVPCSEETCDGTDNDCDGILDEGVYECENQCGTGVSLCEQGTLVECLGPEPEEEICDTIDNDCDGEVDEGQLNACGECGEVPEDVCDGIDNDCDGLTDEDLLRACETICSEGLEICVGGEWSSCTARKPVEESCDSEDNDCDGLVDEELQCNCPPQIIGALMPCQEPPLVCGGGFKSCECSDEQCSSTQWTECAAPCVVMDQLPCNPAQGVPSDEICNNHDDNCNSEVDEQLARDCYTGPPETLNVGLCLPGHQECVAGRWGNEVQGVFVEEMCLGEVLPQEEICNGEDDNCDGIIEEDLSPTDILFIVDTSGSMREEIRAVQEAMTAFSASFQGSPAIRWGLIIGPAGPNDHLKLIVQPVPFDQFIPALGSVREESTSEEMLRDALYLSTRNLFPLGAVPQNLRNLRWNGDVVQSEPPVDQFSVRWRQDVDKLIIIITDEESQSFLRPEIESDFLAQALSQVEGLSVHVFTTIHNANNGPGPWGALAVGGETHELTSRADEMFMSMMGILDEEVCRSE